MCGAVGWDSSLAARHWVREHMGLWGGIGNPIVRHWGWGGQAVGWEQPHGLAVGSGTEWGWMAAL